MDAANAVGTEDMTKTKFKPGHINATNTFDLQTLEILAEEAEARMVNKSKLLRALIMSLRVGSGVIPPRRKK